MKRKLFNYSLFLLSFSLSFDSDWSGKALIICVFFSLFNLKIDLKTFKAPIVYFFASGVLYIFLNMLFLSEDLDFRLLKLLGLIVLFYLLWSSTTINNPTKNRMLVFYVIGVYFCGLFNLIIGLWLSNTYSENIYNSWETLRIIDIHKIYYGMYLNLAFLISAKLIATNNKKIRIPLLLFLCIITSILLIYVGSIASIGVFILLVVQLFLNLFKLENVYRTYLISTSIIPLFILVLLAFPNIQRVFASLDGENSRIRNYQINKEIVLSKPIFGYGIGSERTIMQANRDENSWEFKNNYHAHNQYLELLIGGGIILLIFFLSLFYYLLNHSLQDYKYGLFGAGFVLIILYTALIESIYLRYHGILFLAFFLSCFILANDKDNITITDRS